MKDGVVWVVVTKADTHRIPIKVTRVSRRVVNNGDSRVIRVIRATRDCGVV